MGRITVAKITRTEDSVEIDCPIVVYCGIEGAPIGMIGRYLENLGFQKFDRERLIKESAKEHSRKILFLSRS